jgi:hypothetical protein
VVGGPRRPIRRGAIGAIAAGILLVVLLVF